MNFTALGVVILALLAGAWALRRSAPFRRSARLVSVETATSLGERRSLVIVSVEGKRLLLGLTPTQISLLTELGPGFAGALDASMAGTGEAGRS